MRTPRRCLVMYLGLLLHSWSCKAHEEPVAPAAAAQPADRVREAVHAGSWYPADAAKLGRELRALLDAAPQVHVEGEVVALVAPHAGLRYSGAVAAAAYAQLRGRPVKRVFLLGPSHHLAFWGVALPDADLTGYDTPLGMLPIDDEAVRALRKDALFAGPPRAHELEHSLELNAIFLSAVLPGVRMVPLVVGRLGAEEVGAVAARLRPLLASGDVVVVSSDFTHYGSSFGYAPFAADPQRLLELLEAAEKPLLTCDPAGFDAHLERTKDTICGREPLRVLMALLPGGARGMRAAADTSGRMTGDYESSVSYLSLVYRRAEGWADGAPGVVAATEVLDAEGRQLALRMARATLEQYLRTGRVPEPEQLGVPDSGPFVEELAVFVTLEKHGALRGCIGHVLPVQPLWRDIRDNAIAAAVHDSRFPPVESSELPRVELEISLLSRPRDIPGPEGFVVGRHGVILELAGRRSVFLPQVAPEQGWDRATTLTHLARKAGLPADAWRSPEARLQVFEAQVFAEAETH